MLKRLRNLRPQRRRPAALGQVCRLSSRRTRAGLRSPIPTSLVRAALYFRTVALLASAARNHAGGASVSIEATPTIRARPTSGGQSAHTRRGEAHRSEHRQAAEAAATMGPSHPSKISRAAGRREGEDKLWPSRLYFPFLSA
jgi:hypothetical protein